MIEPGEAGAAEVLRRLEAFCAYQERSPEQVRQKMLKLGVTREEAVALTDHLKASGFLNEERFARLYVRGKFNGRKWGRVKIMDNLRAQGLTQTTILDALDEIPEETYLNALKEEFSRKWKETRGSNHWDKKGRVMRYLRQKGYETELILKLLNESRQEE